jgi:hypothetical protein
MPKATDRNAFYKAVRELDRHRDRMQVAIAIYLEGVQDTRRTLADKAPNRIEKLVQIERQWRHALRELLRPEADVGVLGPDTQLVITTLDRLEGRAEWSSLQRESGLPEHRLKEAMLSLNSRGFLGSCILPGPERTMEYFLTVLGSQVLARNDPTQLPTWNFDGKDVDSVLEDEAGRGQR